MDKMDENFEEAFNYRILLSEDDFYPYEKNQENENNNEQKSVSTHVNNGSNAQLYINNNNNYKNELNVNFSNNIQYIKQNNIQSNFLNDWNKDYNHKSMNINETLYKLEEGDQFHANFPNYLEQNDNNKKTYNTSNTVNVNGKQINTTNDVVSCALNDMFKTNDINLENKKDMQFLKKKKKRRTKKEVENEKKLKSAQIKVNKRLGRKKADNVDKEIPSNTHTKFTDDNMMKKINSYFQEYVRTWINSSFIDEEGNFETIESRVKLKKGIILKIDPKIITTVLKKEKAINKMNETMKNIFSNKLSQKYKKIKENKNKSLIDEIYEKKNQPFVMFILDLTFIQVFNYFNGQNKGEDFKNYFLEKNYDENLVNQFLNNFKNIKIFLNDIKEKEEKAGELKENIQNYIQRLSLLCLNYKEWFYSKYKRSENKKKKEK